MAAHMLSSQLDNHTTQNKQENKSFPSQSDTEMAYLKKYREILPTLPIGKGWISEHLVQYQGCWISPHLGLKAAIWIQEEFKVQSTDIILASFMKTGTTWLKALAFATINRTRYDVSTHPLLSSNPHECLPLLDNCAHQSHETISSTLDSLPQPRLLSTHFPLSVLPNSIITSGCKFVYICREPKDVLVSSWLFMNKLRPKELAPLSLEEAFELFCQGKSHHGPYWDHVLGYWKWSQENPEKILFLKYEDLKKEPVFVVKRLAEFLGQPFSSEEERKGVVQEIIRLCSFQSLSNLEVNKTKAYEFSSDFLISNNFFFRKGQTGDSQNYLTYEMMEKLDTITLEKLSDSGLTFDDV